MKAYLKLRANIELVGDLVLAEREINYLCSSVTAVSKSNLNQFLNFGFSKAILLNNTRKDEIVGYFATINENKLDSLIHKTSFIQEIWIPKNESILSGFFTKDYYCLSKSGLHFFLPFLAAAEFLSFYKNEIKNRDTLKDFIKVLADFEKIPAINQSISRSSTSTLHVHGLHKYKAKFFPRMVRNLILTEAGEYSNPLILDPFVGSGTTLIESSLLGYSSIGVDIDGLSCQISKSKVALLDAKKELIKKESANYVGTPPKEKSDFKFPSWISKKFDRWGTTDERTDLENQISQSLARCNNLNGTKELFKTAISDAISRKFNIRMMGTGVGRFALEIQKASYENLISKNIKYLSKTIDVVDELKSAYDIKLHESKIIEGDATNLELEDSSVDLILTSPPYLPASSGRENYLIGKSISIIALGIMSEREIKEKEIVSLGAMTSPENIISNGLPDDVYKLYSFLVNDDLRKIKANPTYSYYKGLKKALQQSYKVLKPNGKAIYIIGKESVFYTFKTKEVLYRVECDNIFEDIAKSVGFKVLEKIDLELNKKNKNARPRGLDSYFESVFILKK